jgi:hypothetical protein
MQFWKDALDSIFETAGNKPVPNHPVARELMVSYDIK